MNLFLTSSPADPDGRLATANRFDRELRLRVPIHAAGLFITSDPCDREFTRYFSEGMRFMLSDGGIYCASWNTLDGSNDGEAPRLVAEADLIVLSGGHVPTQNAYFGRIGLRNLLRGFDGTVMGISAGSMNAAETVYSQPELKGESIDPGYRRFFPGLGLTKRMLLPHYGMTRRQRLDGKRLFEDITYPDSIGREFLAIPDGSYLFSDGVSEEIRGEAWRIADGSARLLCRAGRVLAL